MNVMKQDAMDDKIIEICKTCEKQMHARGSQLIERCSEAINQTLMDRTAIEDPEEISINPPSCGEHIEIAIRRSWKAR